MDDTHQSLVEKTVCEFISKNPSAKSSPVDITSQPRGAQYRLIGKAIHRHGS